MNTKDYWNEGFKSYQVDRKEYSKWLEKDMTEYCKLKKVLEIKVKKN